MKLNPQTILDAIAFVEMHHFRGTLIVACCLTLKDGRAYVAIEQGRPTAKLDLKGLSVKARASAEGLVERELTTPVTLAAERSSLT